ncbi:MAG: hydrolase TatD [Candidatus Yanofskybacteria bacterium CG10_big_fil_rev_8_21_14_0_10_36_16]|uniref:Hydrolase TatD n=1 Tax=Candidatus Yanofskybacteria bacterium CG10_big_fil_rev_8_21_14_0_10_36_16 TaxID=1975096 RepID=A0A2J0QAC8_9BACT|nr:MAG: hydrolase TatD [Candidatus Yanofskybacteria bacterium CG10_big_fil_rev_8_21_14_0_10_36_16]
MIIDSHCHPQFPQYNKDRDEVIKRALDNKVEMICVGTDLEMSKKAIELSEKHKGIWASVGVHPTDVDGGINVEPFEELLRNKKVVALGEIGLDYYHIKDEALREHQRITLMQFLDMNEKHGLPLIIHCREAYEDMLKIVDSRFRGVIHSWTANWETAKKFVDLGFYIGFNGIITFTDQYNDTVINTPLEKILIETDAPFLAPVPNRGKRNEPLWVKHVAEKISELKKISIEEVGKQTKENTKKLFRIK